MVKVRDRADGRKEIRETIDGVRRSFYGKSSKEVRAKYHAALAAPKKEDKPEQTTIAFRDFFREYEDVARDTMKRRSYETAKDIIRLHILPEFRTKKLKDLNREQVQRLYRTKRDAGLSAARVRRIHGVLSSALNTAVRWHYIKHNVCREVSPPKVEQPEIRPFSKEEAKRFLSAAEQDRYHALFTLGLTSGARFGELAGLYWSDLDLERRVMHIQRSLVTGHGKQTLETPKTKNSRRSVGLSQRALDALVSHRKRMREEGHRVEGDALVFVNTIGGFLNPSHFTYRHFKPLLRRANLPNTTWHAATRHSCTCILLLEGVNPKSVAMQMGWSSVAFMLENYARFLPGWGDNGVMDAALG